MYVDSTTLSLLCPEIVLIFVASFMFVAGAFRPEPRWWAIFTPLTLLVALGLVLLGVEWPFWQSLGRRNQWIAGPVTADALGQWTRLGVLGVGLLLSGLMASGRKELTSEALGSFLLTVAGAMLVCRANDLVLLFVGLELVSIPTYALLFMSRRGRATSEATLKYFFLSILSSALLLYGLSFLYGLGGTTQLAGEGEVRGLREALLEQPGVLEGRSLLAAVATVLIVAGLGFKIAAAPFHFYAPDVYQGVSNSMAALLSVTPKLAGFVALVRLLVMTMPASNFAWQVTLVLAGLTMTLGNISALMQTDVRRMLGFSSIAHSGYLLIGLTVALGSQQSDGLWAGVSSLLFYLATYCIASVAAFGGLAAMETEADGPEDLRRLAGAGRTHPTAAGAVAIAMFSLAGIPIFAGFWGKLNLFLGALLAGTTAASPVQQPWFIGLAILAALNAAVAAGYYLRVVGAMYFQPAASGRSGPAAIGPSRIGALVSAVAAAALLVAIGLAPKPLNLGTMRAASAVVTAASDAVSPPDAPGPDATSGLAQGAAVAPIEP